MPYHGDYYKKNRERIIAKQIEYNRKHAKEQAEYRRRYYRAYHYGISESDFAEMVKSQENKCRICGTVFDDSHKITSPHIDHDHTTGKIRALLCLKCNCGIGNFNEDPVLIESALSYIKHQKSLVS